MKFFFLLLLSPLLSFSQVVPLTAEDMNVKKDSAFAKQYVDSLNHLVGGDTINQSTTPLFAEKYYSAEFHYSPDNYLKILVVSGESCGAYCNPFYSSFVFYRRNGKLFCQWIGEVPFTEIYLLNEIENKRNYLFFSETWCRPRGIETGEEKSFSQFVIIDSLEKVSIQFSNGNNHFNNNGFCVYTGVMCSDYLMNKKINGDFPELIFDAKKKIIAYDYYEYIDNFDICFERKGYFKYMNGTFVQTILIDEEPKEEK